MATKTTIWGVKKIEDNDLNGISEDTYKIARGYKMARGIAFAIELICVVVLVVIVIAYISGCSMDTSDRAYGMVIAGLVLILNSELAKAIFDNSDHTREMLKIMKASSAPEKQIRPGELGFKPGNPGSDLRK